MIRTVNGNIDSSLVNAALCHEHIVCFSHSLFVMSGSDYLDRWELKRTAAKELLRLREKYGLNLFLDCTSPNIGRDTELLQSVSAESGVHIVCSTGFYYTEEPVLFRSSPETIAFHMIKDAKRVNAGVIKAAVQKEEIGEFNEKLLVASAMAQKMTGLPIVLHTNRANRNGLMALEILLESGADAGKTVVGHLDGAGEDYLLALAKYGCYLSLDQLGGAGEEYYDHIAEKVKFLFKNGYDDRVLLSHDKIFFNGFRELPDIVESPGYELVFDHILPRLTSEEARLVVRENAVRLLDN